MSKSRKWTQREENILLYQVNRFPQSISKCFLAVAEETGRTPGAVATHWYSVTSKQPKEEAKPTPTLWQRIIDCFKFK